MTNNLQKNKEVILQELKDNKDIQDFLIKNPDIFSELSFCEYICNLCKIEKEVPEHIINRANIERSFGHQIFKGKRKPSRDTVIQLIFGFKRDINMSDDLLTRAGYSSLNVLNKRDTVILYCLFNKLSICDLQNLLFELDLPLLGKSNNFSSNVCK